MGQTETLSREFCSENPRLPKEEKQILSQNPSSDLFKIKLRKLQASASRLGALLRCLWQVLSGSLDFLSPSLGSGENDISEDYSVPCGLAETKSTDTWHSLEELPGMVCRVLESMGQYSVSPWA